MSATHKKRAEGNRPEEEQVIIYDSARNKKYLRLKLLGKGGFAKCYEVLSENKETLACKIVPKSLLVKPHQKDKMASEVSIHRVLNHPHIVKFETYFEDKDNVYVLLEICRNRSMMELHKRRCYLTDQEVRYYFKQIIEACAYLHDLKVIHRDLKLGNLFLDDELRVKIGDFGLATHIEFDGERKKTLCGTPNYIAPEVLAKNGHSFEVDVWSAGCILYTLYVGKPPFETKSLNDTYNRIKNNDYTIPSKVPKAAQNLIVSMLQRNPSDRPTMLEILKSSFFHNYAIPASLPLSSLSVAPRYNDNAKNMIKETDDFLLASKGRNPVMDPNAAAKLMSKGSKNPLHVIHSFDGKRLVPLKWYPLVPSSCRQNVMNVKPEAHAVRVKDGNMTSFVDENENDNEPEDCYLGDLLKMLIHFISKETEKYADIQLDEAEDPKSTPLYWVSKWVDYSEKYGLGYELCDTTIGVLFNDVTQLLSLPGNTNIGTFIDLDGKESCINFQVSPPDMHKKTQIFKNFYHYMDSNLVSTGADIKIDRDAAIARSPFVRLWIRNDDVIIFQLSCGILQANFFHDHTKVIMCPKMAAITFIDEQRQFKTYPVASLESFGCSKVIVDRVQYVVSVVKKVLSLSASLNHK